METKQVYGRIQHKHDIEANWEKAVNFVPKIGELIVYDSDENHSKQRLKIGDSVTNVNLLPFTGIGQQTASGGEIFGDYENNLAISEYTRAAGENTSAGVTGYYIYSIDFENKILKLTKEYPFLTIDDEKAGNIEPEPESFSTGYEVGDVLSIINADYHYDCCIITAVENNLVTVDTIPFSSIATGGTDRRGVFVLAKPQIGVVTIFGKCSFAEGSSTKAVGRYSHAEGYGSQAIGHFSHAEGRENIAHYAAHAEGLRNKAISRYAHAEGESTTANGRAAHTEGFNTQALEYGAHAEGMGSKATSSAAHAEGSGTTASGEGSHSEGKVSTAEGYASHAEGYETKALAGYTHAEGAGTTATNNYQHVQGKWNFLDENGSSGDYAHVIGNGGNANSRSNAHTVDWKGNAWYAGTVSASEPMKSDDLTTKNYVDTALDNKVDKVEGKGLSTEDFTAALKEKLNSIESNATSVGRKYSGGGEAFNRANNVASGQDSHAEGIASTASGKASHVEGHDCFATEQGAHAEGGITKAFGLQAHAEGFKTTASGQASHAEGLSSKAEDEAAHAEGGYTTAYGNYAHAEGYHTIARGSAQHVQGKFNIEDTDGKYAHIIGNGSGTAAVSRSNAHTVDWEGNAWFSGNITIGATNKPIREH